MQGKALAYYEEYLEEGGSDILELSNLQMDIEPYVQNPLNKRLSIFQFDLIALHAEAVNLLAKEVDYDFYSYKESLLWILKDSGRLFRSYDDWGNPLFVYRTEAFGVMWFHDPGNLGPHKEVRTVNAQWKGVYRQDWAKDILEYALGVTQPEEVVLKVEEIIKQTTHEEEWVDLELE